MLKRELEHIIRAAAAITNQYEIVVVGSQSVLGSVDSPPTECLVSMEADIFVPADESLSDLIDGAIGEGSPFHDSFGYYAQGVDANTSILPDGWRHRLVRLQSLLRHGVVDSSIAQSRVSSMPVDEAAKVRISDLIARLSKDALIVVPPSAGV